MAPNGQAPTADDPRTIFTQNDARRIVRRAIEQITNLSLEGTPDSTKLKAVRINDPDSLARLKDRIFINTGEFLNEKLKADQYFAFQDYTSTDSIRAAATSCQSGVSASRTS